jgi:hypothetical protein
MKRHAVEHPEMTSSQILRNWFQVMLPHHLEKAAVKQALS